MLFDLRYDGCNFAEQTDCGERCVYRAYQKQTKDKNMHKTEVCFKQ